MKKNYVEAHTNLGTIFLKLEKLNDAESCFKKAIKFDPRFAEAYYNLGITQAKQFKYKDAEISYKNAIKCKSNFQEAENNLKKILRQNKLLLNIEVVQKKLSTDNINDFDVYIVPYNIYESKKYIELYSDNYDFIFETYEWERVILDEFHFRRIRELLRRILSIR